ncbi:hypothetical protein T484DRAFT_3640865 [Baffinella frigidus]|nr:hypothetical protein T484DRAFT_3640865 [Cryptophyta sp. CCMP2293]
MDPNAVREASVDPAASAPHDDAALQHAPYDYSATDPFLHNGGAAFFEPDYDWPALGPLDDEDFRNWLGWLDPVNTDHNDPATSLAQDIVTLPSSPAAATPSHNPASKVEKRLRPKQITNALRFWVDRLDKPYATLAEKKLVAEALNIAVAQVTTFCNNHRKRQAKVGGKLTSYCLFSSSL